MRGVFTAAATVFEKRLRGFRVIDLGALVLLLVLVLGVYAFKAAAGQEGGKLREVDQSIAEETRAIRLVRADVARLERPERLERLSAAYLGMSAEDARREATADRLASLIPPRVPQSPPAPPAAPLVLAPASAPPEAPR